MANTTRQGTETQIPVDTTHHRNFGFWWRVLFGILLVLLGMMLGGGGAWLIALGGSGYYLIAGLALIAAGALTIRGSIGGFWLYLVTWLGTLGWAYWEVSLDGWGLVPRVVAPSMLLVLMLLTIPALRRRPSQRSPRSRTVTAAALLAVFGTGTALVAAAPNVAKPSTPPPRRSQSTAALKASADWPVYGGSNAATRYSPLDQITPDNVGRLEKVWVYRSGDMPTGRSNLENTPLKVGNQLISCTATNTLVSLDPATGEEIWRYDPKVSADAIFYGATCRGVAYYKIPDIELSDDAPGHACAERIIEGTMDARLIAVNAKTGEPCAGFGDNGSVDLNRGIGQTVPGWYAVGSPPTIVRGIAVVGARVRDGQAEDAPSGVIRGYDAVTGELAWAWDMGHPDWTGAPPDGEVYTRGTPNMWTMAAADEDLGYVYLPLGNSSVDYYGGNRADYENEYSSSLVAIDVTTGKPLWRFQTVHYDLWDYDLGSQPTLVDLPTESGTVPAVILPSKQGQIYALDRRTGESLFPVEERDVPGGGVEPENLSKTQPYSGYAHLDQPALTEKDMWGMSPLDQLWCRIQFHRANYEGEYTPPSADKPFIQYPGALGGSNWGGVAVDPKRGVLIANYNDMPNYTQLIPRAKADAMGLKPISEGGVAAGGGEGGPQAGSPYAIHINSGWRTPIGMPCSQPPYGHIRAIDLKSGETLWDQPFGTAEENGPFGIPSLLPFTIGLPNNGGPLVTAGGLVFIAATTDNDFRAIDIETGEVVWHDKLPAGGQATPVTYKVDDRQYIAIAPGGHHFMGTDVGDYIIAYALP